MIKKINNTRYIQFEQNLISNEDITILNNDMFIYQKKKGFRFSSDAVLLAHFITIKKKNSLILEFGTGSGIIPIILSQKHKFKKLYALEISKFMSEMSHRSVKLNNLENIINIINLDIKLLSESFKVDYIFSNPPYFKPNTKKYIKNKSIRHSKYEYDITLEEILYKVKKTLNSNGRFFLINSIERFIDLKYILEKFCLQFEKIRFVFSNEKKSAILFMCEISHKFDNEIKNIEYLENFYINSIEYKKYYKINN